MNKIWIVMKHIQAVDWERDEVICVSHDKQECEDLITKLTIAVENTELFDNICRIGYYLYPTRLTSTPEEFTEVYEDHKGDRG